MKIDWRYEININTGYTKIIATAKFTKRERAKGGLSITPEAWLLQVMEKIKAKIERERKLFRRHGM